jgi:DNA-binding SARP family transcriptional activator/tetratricopeptide (TPR) repeat protein
MGESDPDPSRHRDDLRFELLGPLVVRVGDRPVDLGARRRERCLLGLLLLEPGRAIPVDRLIDLLWDDAAPADARATLISHVSRLRARIDPERRGLLRNQGDGYLVDVDPDRVDASRFAALVAGARSARDPAERARILRAALGLWRGPLLADVAGDRLRDRVGAGLAELRRSALEERLDADLECGRHADVVTELTDLHARHPARERLAGLTMLALYRTGRQTDALDTYQRVRERLATGFGVDPGPELRDLHRAILRHEVPSPTPPAAAGPAPRAPTGPRPPAQLPAGPRHFGGRDEAIRQLDAVLADPSTSLAVVAIVGAGGIGKTALALHFADQVGHRFPDGQIYLNLRAYGATTPLRPAEALGRVLLDLGVTADRIPADPEAAAALYRTTVAGRRLLLLLDDVDSVEQMRPLIPGTPTMLVLATSRHRLRGLVALDGAHRVTLGPLEPADADALLRRILGAEAPSDLIATLTASCDGLPLALRIAAANVADDPAGPDDYLRRLASEPLGSLEIDDDGSASVHRVLGSSYAGLRPEVQRLFRLLGLVPTRDIAGAAVAALAGRPRAEVASAIGRLADTHLLYESRPGRWIMHDLVRTYAHGRAMADEPADDRRRAVGRLLDWALAGAATVNAAVAPHRDHPMPPPRSEVPPLPFPASDRRAGLAHLDDERDGLPALVDLARRYGDDRAAAHLAYALAGYYQATGDGPDSLAVYRAGLAAAERIGDPGLECSLHKSLGISHAVARDFTTAVTHLRRARSLARTTGDALQEASVLMNLGRVHFERGDTAQALRAYERSLRIRQAHGPSDRLAPLLNNIGCLHHAMGDSARALRYMSESLALHRTAGDASGEGRALDSLGQIHLGLGHLDEAIDCFEQALATLSGTGDREAHGSLLDNLGTAHLHAGDRAAAAIYLRRAVEAFRERHDGYHEAIVRDKLAAVEAEVDAVR